MNDRKIICYGDSNTYGWDPAHIMGGPYENPWPKILAILLDCKVENHGFPGREAIAARAHLRHITKDLTKNDLFIIMLGTNDLLHTSHPDIRMVADRMERVLKTLLSFDPEFRILLIAPMTTDIAEDGIDEASKELPVLYQELAARYHIAFFNAAELQLPLAFDGIHFSEEAHHFFAHALSIRILALYEE